MSIFDVSAGKRGSDDYFYNKLPVAREFLPRGLAFIGIKKVENTSNGSKSEEATSDSSEIKLVLCGTYKFTASAIDDDDTPEGVEVHADEVPEGAEYVLWSSKANGKCCHISACSIEGTDYWVLGSKLVHLLVHRDPSVMLTDLSNQVY